MKIIFLIFLIFINGLSAENFENVMENLKALEDYIKDYISEKSSTYTLNHLLTCYIRKGSYSGKEWDIAGGSIPNDLSEYIITKDKSAGTNAQLCKTYGEIDLPNKEKLDFVHFFAVMNGIENGNSYSSNFAHLVGWGGDTCQLFQDIKGEKGDLDTLKEITISKYFLKSGQFGLSDFISDIDAPTILNKKTNDNQKYFSEIIKEYYNSKEYEKRINNFVSLTFPTITKKEDFYNVIFNQYSKDTYIQILECKYGMRNSGVLSCYIPGDLKTEYTEHQKAAVFAVSEYLANNYNYDDSSDDSTDDKTDEPSDESEEEYEEEGEKYEEEEDKGEKEEEDYFDNKGNSEKEKKDDKKTNFILLIFGVIAFIVIIGFIS